jgi:hypothetical protein
MDLLHNPSCVYTSTRPFLHFSQAPVFRNFWLEIECFSFSRQKLRAITFSRQTEIDRSGQSQWPKAQLARVL